MLEGDGILAIVREWILKAENDLTNASHTLRLAAQCPTDTVCFHAQQCVEKYLKALLTYNNVEFPKTHNIGILTAFLPKSFQPVLSVEEQSRLTDFATVSRYPGDYEDISLAEARKAVVAARRVRGFVRKNLPRAATVRKR